MYSHYSQVPWYRKSSLVSLMTVLGLCCGPSILAVCILVLTGDVYYDKRDESGNLKTWGPLNKVAAVIILLIQVAATAYQIWAFSKGPAAPA